jgi:lipoprotein-anchoring transpeptidase ErfK/SrfK
MLQQRQLFTRAESKYPAAFRRCAVTALLLGLSGGSAVAGPYVVRGIGPSDPVAAYAEPAPVPPPAPGGHGGLGGGFIEMLVTGADPAPRAAYYAPPPRAARRQVAAYAPAASATEFQREVDPAYMRADIDYATGERAGTIVVDTPNKFLYYVKGGGRAIRYGIGVGRPGFEWSGVKSISRKAEWPDWTPPAEMLARRPDLPRHMNGGPDNPLGARALYLGSSLYRIHGTNEPYTIGQNVSSGCIRMMNDDVIDLYGRVQVGARVVVR